MPRDKSIPVPPKPLTDRERFLLDCRYVALVMGGEDEYAAMSARVGGHYDGNMPAARVYRDEVVEIVADPTSPAIAIEKLENGNPVVSVMADGTSVRDHGEQVHLFDHMRSLVEQAARAKSNA